MVSLRFLSRLTKGCGRAYSVFFIILTMLVTLSACAYQERHAGSYDPAGDISERIANQQQRIGQGIANGQLNRREADIVQGNLNYIRDEYSRFLIDGRLPHHEHMRLNGLLNQNSDMIYREKHNTIKQLY